MNHFTNRRLFVRNCLAWGTAAMGGGVLAACAGAQKTPVTKTEISKADTAAADPCSDLTGVDPTDVQKRKSLGYTNKSPLPDSQCDNCKLWVPAKEGKECGGCLLFTGPVNPEGHCTYWAPQV
jgi:hypothetical protein